VNNIIALISLLVASVSIKTISYAIWEFRNKNKLAGFFVLFLVLSVIFLTIRYINNVLT